MGQHLKKLDYGSIKTLVKIIKKIYKVSMNLEGTPVIIVVQDKPCFFLIGYLKIRSRTPGSLECGLGNILGPTPSCKMSK